MGGGPWECFNGSECDVLNFESRSTNYLLELKKEKKFFILLYMSSLFLKFSFNFW